MIRSWLLVSHISSSVYMYYDHAYHQLAEDNSYVQCMRKYVTRACTDLSSRP
eukprot:SAG11_NODE_26484_length_344_cov_1.465306_2_plen_51_part_01